MAEGGNPSRYVKLTKEQAAPSEDIKPGELNQPIDVPQVFLFFFLARVLLILISWLCENKFRFGFISRIDSKFIYIFCFTMF